MTGQPEHEVPVAVEAVFAGRVVTTTREAGICRVGCCRASHQPGGIGAPRPATSGVKDLHRRTCTTPVTASSAGISPLPSRM